LFYKGYPIIRKTINSELANQINSIFSEANYRQIYSSEMFKFIINIMALKNKLIIPFFVVDFKNTYDEQQ